MMRQLEIVIIILLTCKRAKDQFYELPYEERSDKESNRHNADYNAALERFFELAEDEFPGASK